MQLFAVQIQTGLDATRCSTLQATLLNTKKDNWRKMFGHVMWTDDGRIQMAVTGKR
jgi:hypothetical protein